MPNPVYLPSYATDPHAPAYGRPSRNAALLLLAALVLGLAGLLAGGGLSIAGLIASVVALSAAGLVEVRRMWAVADPAAALAGSDVRDVTVASEPVLAGR